MKTLYLMRHAKSDWSANGTSDHGRTLSPRGQEAAARIVLYCRQENIAPQHILCSSSARTHQTLDLINGKAFPKVEESLSDDLYLAEVRQLVAIIKQQADSYDSVMIIGHNPGLHELALQMAGNKKSFDVQNLQGSLPSGSLLALSFDIASWSDFGAIKGELLRFIKPKELPAAVK